jgi:beta-N-acetylhexosaminidase
MALKAGADLVMVSHHLDLQEEAVRAIARAVQEGELSLARLEEAASRTAALKKSVTGQQAREAERPEPARLIADARSLQIQSAQQGLTLLCARSMEPWPEPRSVAVVLDGQEPHMIAAGASAHDALFQSVAGALPGVDVRQYRVDGDLEAAQLGRYDWLLYLTSGINSERTSGAPWLASHPRSAVLLVGTPYAFPQFGTASRVYALYENTPWMVQAAIAALLGRGASAGSLPVQVGAYARGYRFTGDSCRERSPS